MNYQIGSLQGHPLQQLPKKSSKVMNQRSEDFGKLLQEQELKISKHAQTRLQERNIQIDEQQWQKISEKISEAKEKGITDSLVITDNAALVVSAKNHTVVTAMPIQEANSHIFTNINGTIIVNQ
ncbi:TIGR02530 family flagellar biosynthesis protein [Virgibacillus sp. 179-BFC.A HS]|uniref:TIGR02530 family flagellar biosynthesis protein n=1 Tax=Tigheibacillus jepli TaxID=3035914 RepID=A0ABU5CK60_9BACI|nr:TIGR02530 family flagellar biosynthesis protein [Virgibacillus sp. 179-BFC.A HS]MDY0405880.1 TIGR02530 family flagellar biosynthesis protein [Virgibacillus sp. 179-BFC.A HS]